MPGLEAPTRTPVTWEGKLRQEGDKFKACLAGERTFKAKLNNF